MKTIIFLAALMWAAGCQNILPYVGTPKQIKEFSINNIQLYLITNRDQFPVEPRNPNTLGMWVIRYGMQEEIWVCAEVNDEVWTPAPGILEHELIHALNHRDKLSIQNPDNARQFGEVVILHETQP